MSIIKKLAKKGAFGLTGLAMSKKGMVDKIARNGGLGLVGMMAAKDKNRSQPGRPMMEDIMTAEQVPANRAAPIMAGDVDAMMGRGAQRDMPTMKKGGKVKKMAKGGSVSSASKRGDGCATKGKTKGKFV